jgi:hypothetical protein
MIASTSSGAGITIVFALRRLESFSLSFFTLGKPLLFCSFSAQVFFDLLLIVCPDFSQNEKGHTAFKQSSVPQFMVPDGIFNPSHEESDRDQA